MKNVACDVPQTGAVWRETQERHFVMDTFVIRHTLTLFQPQITFALSFVLLPILSFNASVLKYVAGLFLSLKK